MFAKDQFEFDNQTSYIKNKKVAKSNYYEDKSSCCVNYGNRCVTLTDELPKMRV